MGFKSNPINININFLRIIVWPAGQTIILKDHTSLFSENTTSLFSENTTLLIADFMTLLFSGYTIMQVRRYLYGNMTEITLKKYLNGTYKRLKFKGIMSFYPLVNDENQMLELDKWLVSTIMNVLKRRKQLLLAYNPNFNINQFPFNCDKEKFIDYCRTEKIYNKKALMQIPSFLRIHRAIKLGLTTEGIVKIMNPDSLNYYE